MNAKEKKSYNLGYKSFNPDKEGKCYVEPPKKVYSVSQWYHGRNKAREAYLYKKYNIEEFKQKLEKLMKEHRVHFDSDQDMWLKTFEGYSIDL